MKRKAARRSLSEIASTLGDTARDTARTLIVEVLLGDNPVSLQQQPGHREQSRVEQTAQKSRHGQKIAHVPAFGHDSSKRRENEESQIKACREFETRIGPDRTHSPGKKKLTCSSSTDAVSRAIEQSKQKRGKPSPPNSEFSDIT